jgi:hypothetical protein
MARGGGRSSGRSSSPNRSSNTYNTRSTAQPTAPPRQSMPVQGQSGGMLGGIGSTIMTGMAFGGGSAIGHKVVGSLMGGSGHKEQQPQVEANSSNQVNNQQQQQNPCASFNTKFIDCLKMSNNDISMCQSIFDDLKVCQKSFNI